MQEEVILLLGIYVSCNGNCNPFKVFQNNYKELNKTRLKEIARKEIEVANSLGVEILFCKEENYPQELKKISFPPPFLYIKGKFQEEIFLIAIVGARKFTYYGKEVAEFLTKGLVNNGIGIVSGLARGIDTIAHKTALLYGGYTVSVLGCGIDICYPPENKKLFEEIAEKGLIVTEFPIGTKPKRENFPRRNRIISGLSKGVIVIEASETSGSLITAKWALHQGKEVFCVPGSIFSPLSKGTHLLLKEGAILIDSYEDVLFLLGLEKNKKKKLRNKQDDKIFEDSFFGVEKEILKNLSHEPIHIDELIAKISISKQEILSILSELELTGAIEILPGKFVKKKKIF